MPRQKGIILLKGTLYNNTYYKINGQHLVRKKTYLNKQRVVTYPAFANSRKASGTFAKAAAIASQIYKQLPTTKLKHGLIDKLTGMANTLLHEGVSKENVIKILQLKYI